MPPKILPVSDPAAARRYGWQTMRRHPKLLAGALGLNAAAAAAGLVGPRLLGELVQDVAGGTTAGHVTRVVIVLLFFVLVQAWLIRGATVLGGRLSQAVLAEMREKFIERVLALPLSTAENAGSGDLISRASRGVDEMQRTAQYALPAILTAGFTFLLSIVGMLAVSPALTVVILVAVPPVALVTRWYLSRSTEAYRAYKTAAAGMTEELAASTDGAATIEALGLAKRRVEAGDASVAATYAADIGTLRLRTVFLPTAEIGYRLPMIAALLLGGYFYSEGWASLSAVTAVVLYTQQMSEPISQARDWLTEMQTATTSLQRLLGVTEVPPDRQVREHTVDSGQGLILEKVTFGYGDGDGPEVLHGINITVGKGERLAIVGPSGAGKSTLGRLMAGIHGPSSGSVRLGGAPLIELPLEQLRREVALVSHEQYVLGGTLRENLALAVREGDSAADEVIWSAVEAVEAEEWVQALPDGLDTTIGSGGTSLSPAQSQQLAIARLIVADPKVLVLDEATSLLDPTSARDLERSLNALLEGRTVITIAHRLHTAYDADRIAVIEDGRVVELGSHTELIANAGYYARLWSSWHGEPTDTKTGTEGERCS
ncbi:ABC transporter ATP-binding protein [Streptomyces sp. DSM 40750]|uniref:ABC transporter ATP-binding protein n=1 Tax=Streptomyces sp. DSM 40750 TaxID=2801030 RepID=UPI00214B6833|nr:ABC transporter ATP-binding protein [Streptomyces sp. DSM 40750]UUU25948.1 ABC transporter ATP-binding protein/permease [Streptomyces sp. DSM 40750]